MKKLSIVIALLVLFPCPVLAGWQWVNPKPTGEDILGWSVLSSDTHIVLGTNGFIMKTSDSGSTWTGHYAEGPSVTEICAISFVSSNVGYGVDGRSGHVLKTVDGGKTWGWIYSGSEWLYDVCFLDENRGFAVGAFGAVLSTQDGGQHWNSQELSPDRWFTNVFFVNAQVGFVVSTYDYFSSDGYWKWGYWKTSDGGASWVHHDSGDGPLIYDLSFVNETVGYGLAVKVDEWGIQTFYLSKTRDAGETWSYTQLNLWSWAYTLYFQAEGTGVFRADSGIYRTVDDGNSFELVASDVENSGFAGDGRGRMFAYGYYGMMFASTDGGATWRDLQTWVIPYESNGLLGGLFTGKETGYVFSYDSVFKSSDSGLNWRPTLAVQDANIQGLLFPSAQVGYAVGEEGLWRTIDAGETWSYLAISGWYPGPVEFATEQRGFAGDGYQSCWWCAPEQRPTGLHMTTDGGSSWSQVQMPVPAAEGDSYQVAALSFPRADIGYLARPIYSYDYSRPKGTELWKIVDPGGSGSMTLELVYTFPKIEILSLKFRNELNGLAASENAIYRTIDGGKTWEKLPFGTQGGTFEVVRLLFDPQGGAWYVFTAEDRAGWGQLFVGIAKSDDPDGSSWSSIQPPPDAPSDIFLHPNGIWCLYSFWGSFWDTFIVSSSLSAQEAQPPNTPTNLEPQNGVALPQTTILLRASPFSDQNPDDTHLASHWQVAVDPSFYTIVVDSGPDPDNLASYTVSSGLTYAQTYYFRVRYEDSSGLWSEWSHFTRFLISHPPERPSLNPALLPPDSVFYTTTPSLVFTDYVDRDGDPQRATEVRVSRGATCNDLVWGQIYSGAVTQASIPAGILASGSTYCVQVRYQDGNLLWSDWSAPAQIKVSAGPQQPANLRPAAEAEIDSVQLEASAFTDAFAAQQASHWQICRGEDFLCIVFEAENTSGDLIRLTPPNVFVADRTYSWRVRYWNAHGVWSPWSQPTSFTFVPFL